MKTYKHLYQKLCSLDNLYLAYKKARKGKTKKEYVFKFQKNLFQNLNKLQHELINKTYKPNRLKRFIIRDPKTRKICKSIFRDRIVHHALINILEPIYEKLFTFDSYASRKGKGQHKALERFDYFKRKVTKNGKKLRGIKDNNYVCGYVLKADIKSYFDSVDHNILIGIIKKKIRDKSVIWLIKQILTNHLGKIRNRSMPLGNYTSQFFANVYLNGLDYFVKHELKVRYYIRYVDDLAVLHNSREQLEIWKQEISTFLKIKLKLNLHPDKVRIVPLHKGLCLLGFRVFYYYKLLKKANIKQIRKKIDEWNELCVWESLVDFEKTNANLEGWLAHAKHGNTYKLRQKIISEFNVQWSK